MGEQKEMLRTWWQDRRVMVSGAAGFIGSHAVDLLVDYGAEVTAVVSPQTPDSKIAANLSRARQRITISRTDLIDGQASEELARGQEVVLHFAAMDGSSEYKKKHSLKILEANTAMTRSLLHSSALHHVKHFFLMSSIEVYLRGVVPLGTVQSALAPSTFVDGYAWSKRFSEILAQLYRQTHGFSLTIVRAGNVYGPRDYLDAEKGRVIPSFIRNSLQGNSITILGDGSQKRTFLHVNDFLKTVLNLLPNHDSMDPVTITASESISIKDLASTVLQLTGSRSVIAHDGKPPLHLGPSVTELPRATGMSEELTLHAGLVQTIENIRQRLGEQTRQP